MARRCKLSKKGPLVGMNVSHSHIRTKKVQRPNLQLKRIFLPEENRWVRVKLTARALRTVTKKGLLQYVKDEGLRLQDVLY
ncbi:MAG: 50S ribosomal protein L28 [bacterium]